MAGNTFEDEWASALDEQQRAEKNAAQGQSRENGDFDAAWKAALDEQSRTEDEGSTSEGGADVDWASALDEQRRTEKLASTQAGELVRKEKAKEVPMGVQILLKIPLEVSIRLGETRMLISDLLQLGQGSIVELSKPAGEGMDIIVNGKYLGLGEVVVVNEHFGVRVTSIAAPEDRIKSLR